MRFLQFINNKKFTIISAMLFVYIISSLFEGERGLISYYNKQKLKENLIEEKKSLNNQLALVEKKNKLLNEKIDLDYLEILYREKFMVGKSNEKIYSAD
tara:strand:+ start:226 stop:522 length:297 start_codon:yes stop_codon:yes gene_type:complete